LEEYGDLNPEDFDIEEDPEISSKVELENAQQTSDVFNTPGRGRHRSDFTEKNFNIMKTFDQKSDAS